jgi:hypothetical protein
MSVTPTSTQSACARGRQSARERDVRRVALHSYVSSDALRRHHDGTWAHQVVLRKPATAAPVTVSVNGPCGDPDVRVFVTFVDVDLAGSEPISSEVIA